MVKRRGFEVMFSTTPRGSSCKLRFGQVEVERAAVLASLIEHAAEFGREFHRLHRVGEAGARLRVAIEDGLRVLVSKLGRRLDHAVVELRVHHASLAIDLHHRGLGQTILAFDEAADAARQGMGQHRHHEAREVNGVAALVSAGVEGRTFANVVGHIGDVHGEDVVAVRVAGHADGIVVILGGLGIYGDRGPGTEVGALRDLALRHRSRGRFGFGHHRGREIGGELVLGQDDLEVDTGLIHPAEALDHFARGRTIGGGGAGDLQDDHVAGLDLEGVGRGLSLDVLEEAAVERNHVGMAAGDFVAADHALDRVLHHLHHFARESLFAATRDPRQHGVAVGGAVKEFEVDFERGVGRSVGGSGKRVHEGEAGGMADYAAEECIRRNGFFH
jgi:hypothetical protein